MGFDALRYERGTNFKQTDGVRPVNCGGASDKRRRKSRPHPECNDVEATGMGRMLRKNYAVGLFLTVGCLYIYGGL